MLKAKTCLISPNQVQYTLYSVQHIQDTFQYPFPLAKHIQSNTSEKKSHHLIPKFKRILSYILSLKPVQHS